MNNLQTESSPYLQQHADNPVDWYPWNDTALAKARAENKPIFVSVGYSTCHWCHVMAHESFSDQTVADKLKRDFVAIKVDREERPDLDATFMQACQLMTGQGGWPLNLFLTPEGQPFYAFTYAPRTTTGRYPGFMEIIDKIAQLWHEHPDNLLDSAQKLSAAIVEQEEWSERLELGEQILSQARERYREQFDHGHGGFGAAPKFPQPHNLTLLLRLAQRFNDADLEQMALKTLDAIMNGGISDQLGGGIHRYSVDAQWLVPHFEKMLYDQALISDAYLEAWQISGQTKYRAAAEKVLDYCLRDLRDPGGAFYCGEDADSEGREGTFYLWTQTELEACLSPEQWHLCKSYYATSARGQFDGKNILHVPQTLASAAGQLQIPLQEAEQLLASSRDKLFRQRNLRHRPHLDHKILTGWNGLLIAALAKAARLLERDDYLHAALDACDFICTQMISKGQLQRRHCQGETGINAFHDDYAYLIYGLSEVFLAGGPLRYLQLARQLLDTCLELFGDGHDGLYDAEKSVAAGLGRGRNKQDGAIPAAASVTAYNMIRLARLLNDRQLETLAEKLLARNSSHAGQYPTSFAFLLQGLDLYLRQPLKLVLVPGRNQRHPEPPWLASINSFRPQLLTVIAAEPRTFMATLPEVADKYSIDNVTTAWLCCGTSCLEPQTSAAGLEEQLRAYAPLKTFSR